jgi:hypothetical protein
LANQLHKLDTEIRGSGHDHGHRLLRAVGLLGSDVYDKLELLKALRPVFPAALATPKEDRELEELIGNEDPDGRNPAEAS